MKRSTARWTTTLAAAALLTLPVSGLAQEPPPSQPPTQQPPTQQPPTQQPPTQQPPTTQPPTGTPSTPAAPGSVDQEAAKQHLTAARNSLSEMTQLPAASQLTGEARTQVSQLITNFNELITTKSEWRSAFAKVEANLNALVGSQTADESAARASGTAGAVGTSGTVTVDPEIKAKLIEVRNHLDKFEQAAGGASASPAPESSAASSAMTASGTTDPAAASAATPQTAQPSAAQSPQMDSQELLRHVQAIEAILSVQGPETAGTTGTATPPTGTTTAPGTTHSGIQLSAAQVDQLRTHLNELKRLLNQR